MRRTLKRRLASCILFASAATAMAGQGRIQDTPHAAAYRPPELRDDGFAFCYLHFNRDRVEEGSSGWRTDYPLAGRNLVERLQAITLVRTVRPDSERHRSQQWVTSVDRNDIYMCPLVLVSDAGTMNLDAAQARRLGEYLLKGGFLWIDDTWGSESWGQVLRELGKVVPPSWRIETPTFDHPIYRMLYRVTETLQVSHVHYWTTTNRTDERGGDSPLTPLRVLLDDRDRVAAVLTHNTDIADTWERQNVQRFFDEFASDGYALGANVVLHAMTH